jgi:DNA-binding response OmpR family regulator
MTCSLAENYFNFMKKILIIDDEEEIRYRIRDFLVKDNFEADQTSNGKEAPNK